MMRIILQFPSQILWLLFGLMDCPFLARTTCCKFCYNPMRSPSPTLPPSPSPVLNLDLLNSPIPSSSCLPLLPLVSHAPLSCFSPCYLYSFSLSFLLYPSLKLALYLSSLLPASSFTCFVHLHLSSFHFFPFSVNVYYYFFHVNLLVFDFFLFLRYALSLISFYRFLFLAFSFSFRYSFLITLSFYDLRSFYPFLLAY